MKFLIAGYGSIGRRHFRNLLELGERDIVLYRTGRSTLPVEELKDFPVETDLAQALDHRPDVVIVANPTAYHLDVAVPAAERGCHLLMEKPISHSLEGVDQLQTALEYGGGQALVGFQFRFHPGLQRLWEMINTQAAGRPISVRAEWGEYLPNWHPWEDYRTSYSARSDLGGGVVLTLSHPLDYLRWLMGEVDAVTAMSGKISDLEVEVDDFGEIILHFASGSIGSVHLNYYQRPAVHRLEIACSNGTLLWNNSNGAARIYRPESESWESFPPPEDFDRNVMFLTELRHMIAVARGEADPVCTLADGRRALEIALAVHHSSQTGQIVHL